MVLWREDGTNLCLRRKVQFICAVSSLCCGPTAELRAVTTDSMEQSLFWKTNSRSASQEIPRLVLNFKVHYRVHKSPSLVPVLSQMHPVPTLPSYFPKIHSNVIFTSKLKSSE